MVAAQLSRDKERQLQCSARIDMALVLKEVFEMIIVELKLNDQGVEYSRFKTAENRLKEHVKNLNGTQAHKEQFFEKHKKDIEMVIRALTLPKY